ncbi:MAG: NAD(P)H-dependent glycerol-3-phosphate dehydrogenase [Tissierellia bacterium]|nr:NAD(P)H-dependent glycerol-3-phosphate dehydrogenase [Tissierellia bacterium]
MKNIGIIGGGSWGSALAQVLADNGHKVKIYMRDKSSVDEFNLKGTNEKYLPGIVFDRIIRASSDINELSDSEILIFAIPTQSVDSVISKIHNIFDDNAIFVNVAKGIEIKTYKRISQIFNKYIDEDRFVALSGPTHAEEVSIRMPSAIVASSVSERSMNIVQDLFMNKYFRVYTNEDLIGVELGGATKNILALGLGIADGLGYGDNTKAAIMTRGMHEIVRLGTKLGGSAATFYGLTGMGDLIVTSTSMHSRNRKAGICIGKGYSMDQTAKEVKMVVEGIKTCEAVYHLSNDLNIEMPITQEIYKILFKDSDVSNAVENLMERDKKREVLE